MTITRLPTLALLAASVAFFGCSDDSETVPQTSLDPRFACESAEFDVGKPLESPQFKPAEGGLQAPTQDTYLVHTTQIFVPSEKTGAFFEAFAPILDQLETTPGMIAYSFASDSECGDYRTLGIWESEEAMYDFVVSGAHAEAMAKTSVLSDLARVTHWDASVAEVNVLEWQVAKAKILNVPASTLY